MADSRLIPRNLRPWADEVLNAFPIIVIEGARQVGKSTFAQLLLEHRAGRAVTLDDPDARTAARSDPLTFVDQAGDGTLVIDEIQRAPELILPIKASVDRRRTPGRFLLTGSADLLRLERTPDSLAGRAITLSLRGLSQGEHAHLHDDFVGQLSNLSSAPDFRTEFGRKEYADAIRRGGYPELANISNRLRAAWTDGYLDRIVQRDASDIIESPNPSRLRTVLTLLAANQAGELVKARVAQQTKIPESSITTYLELLRTLFLVDWLPPWTPNLTRREIGRPKAIVADSALALTLTGVAEEALASIIGADHLGPLLEGLVVAELLKQQSWSETKFRMYHYRDRDGLEVDLIIELPGGSVYGIEVKASGTFKADNFKGLDALAEKAGDRFLGGVVLNTGTKGYRYSQKLWGLPVSALWEWRL